MNNKYHKEKINKFLKEKIFETKKQLILNFVLFI